MPSAGKKHLPQLVAIIIVGLLVGAFYWLNSASQDKTAGSMAEVPVRVTRVRQVSMPFELRLTGELLPVKQAEVVSRLAGRVTEVRFKAGDFVPAGAIVVTIRASDLDERLNALEAGVRAAKQDLELLEFAWAESEKRLSQERDLLRRDLIPRRDVERSESAAATARAQAELARARIAQLAAMVEQGRALKSFTRLSAPFSGKVSNLSVKPSMAVAEGGLVFSIVSLDTLKLVATVSSARPLRVGMKAHISTSDLPGIVSHGQVVRFETEKDSEGKNETEIQVDNDKGILRPGMTAEVSIDFEAQQEVFLVPRSAVVSENKGTYVYKFSEGQAARQDVVLGLPRGDEIAIAHGLNAEDAIIVDLEMIKPGTRVRPLNAPANSAEEKR